METWLIIFISIIISLLLKLIFNLLYSTKKPSENLPPGPLAFPIIGNLLWPRKSFGELEPLLRSLHAKFGPIVTLYFGSRPAIFILDRSIAHQALIQNGAVFADRPPFLDGKNQNQISTALYGATWRVLRRNLTAEIFHSSRVKSYSHARKWVLQNLIDQLKFQTESGDPVPVLKHFQFSMASLLVTMCFGQKLEENQIREIMDINQKVLMGYARVNLLNIWPRVTKIVFRSQWEKFFRLRECHKDKILPYIRDRKKVREENLISKAEENKDNCLAYVDTLFDLQLPDENRKLNQEEILGLCSELLIGGTDTTATALQWIMANLVKYPHIQDKLFMEIKEVVGDGEELVAIEDDLQKMPYLKAVILEGLRRHPPGHFVLPHAVKQDFVLNGYVVPKNGTVNFMIADMGWDPEAWKEPMAFRPERFLATKNGNNGGEVFDITGSREIKMMPFGVGRRICPGLGLALFHLEYFVANLVLGFEWKAVDGDDIDLEIKHEFSVMMKNPLQVKISPRFR